MARWVVIFAALSLAGCGPQRAATQPSPTTVSITLQPASRPDPRSLLSLNEIMPKPILPPPIATEDSDPPVKALQLYARGVDQLLQHHPFEAADTFQAALLIDPNSYELCYELGMAHLDRVNEPNDRAFDAFEHAAALRPDNLRIHLLLGREYFADNQMDKAIQHLRLAMQTSQYKHDEPGSGAVDFFLARALQQEGYDLAALNEYTVLIHRLAAADQSLSNDPDIGFLVSSPEPLWLQIGALYEKHGQYADALAAYEPLAKYDPSNFDLQAKVVRLLAKLGRMDQATTAAADLVARFRAGADSLALLREVYHSMGREQDVAGALQRLHEHDPADHGILFALSDILVQQGKYEEARKLLAGVLAKNPADADLVEKLFNLYLAHDDLASAAGVLIERLAAKPDSLSEIDPLWEKLIRSNGKAALRLPALQRLAVPVHAESARLYLVARLANLWQRDALARRSLEQAVALSPPFAPAYRSMLSEIWARSDWDDAQKTAAANELASTAQSRGAASLAAEVRGTSLIAAGKIDDAAAQFKIAQNLGADSADFQLTYAGVLRHQGDSRKCEQMLWTLVSNQPHFDLAWKSLYGFYQNADKDADTLKVLAQWLRADPGSAEARMREVWWYVHQGQTQDAQQLLLKILDDRPDDAEVLNFAEAFYRQMNQVDQFISKLNELRKSRPENLALVSWLLNDYTQLGRPDDAVKLLDETRRIAGNDLDVLYQLSGMYQRIGKTQQSQDLLAGIIQADPANGSASNDLGFAWADAGKNLDRAEKLIRVAVAAEPDNQAFLDSMGWVLYKRGKFAEAGKYMQKAIGPAALPDPEVLDHYGDVLYRLGKLAEAQKQWKRALDRLKERGDDAQPDPLQARLGEKLRQAAAGKSVDVAPVPENK